MEIRQSLQYATLIIIAAEGCHIAFRARGRALQPSSQSGLPLWQDNIFIPLARSASDASDHFCILEDRAVEVGARITI
ncbi:hypothetical protein BB934_39440 (plasmid) [Microvirga ossetica]|uniref:Uncharacterized protein n=1 Tax=Microvirga ossetica TaxID=1882682 RepID=A0A1B2EWH1_9HYPH|nr:hypothetical protein BB934_39440 [Microvirga ossetica]